MKTAAIRHITAIMLMGAITLGASAQSAMKTLNAAIKRFETPGGVTADYVLANDQGSTRGTIDMKGKNYRIMSNDLKCWYNGTTQWTYSSISGEVCITVPTLEEMQMSNPYVALTTLKKSCKIYKVNTKTKGVLVLKLVPKAKDQQVKHIMVYIKTDSNAVTNVNFEMTDGSYYRTTITNFKEAKHSNATFNYDSKAVPKGTEVVDLR